MKPNRKKKKSKNSKGETKLVEKQLAREELQEVLKLYIPIKTKNENVFY
jgi:hypothetical protein